MSTSWRRQDFWWWNFKKPWLEPKHLRWRNSNPRQIFWEQSKTLPPSTSSRDLIFENGSFAAIDLEGMDFDHDLLAEEDEGDEKEKEGANTDNGEKDKGDINSPPP